MTDKNSFGMPRGHSGSARYPAHDALDDIDEAVAQITDADIEDRLRQTLDRADPQSWLSAAGRARYHRRLG